MSKRNHIIKKLIKENHKAMLMDSYLGLDYQPHCNDRWRAIRKLNGYPESMELFLTGLNTYWSSILIDPRMEKLDLDKDPNVIPDDYWLNKRLAWLKRKGIE